MTTTEERIEVEEPMPTENQQHNDNRQERKSRPGLKLLLIAGMCTAFLIPQFLIRNLVRERQSTESDAETEVFAKWGGNQTLIGPFIELTYSSDSTSKERYTILLLPEKLDVKGDVSTKALKRGIYDFTVYETSLGLSGQFKLPKDFEKNMAGRVCHFESVNVIVSISNLKGLRDKVLLNLGGTKLDMEPNGNIWNGLSCAADLSALLEGKAIDFSVTIPFKGSGNLMFAPLGQTTNVNLTSDCATPSFNGEYLPDERQVTNKGLQASWK